MAEFGVDPAVLPEEVLERLTELQLELQENDITEKGELFVKSNYTDFYDSLTLSLTNTDCVIHGVCE